MSNRNEETTITVTNTYGTYSVSVNDSDLGIESFIDLLVRPVLLAVGYNPSNVNDSLGEQ